MCKCIDTMNLKLMKRKCSIKTTEIFQIASHPELDTNTPRRVLIQLECYEGNNKRLPTIHGDYCPFCGKKYISD